MPKLYFDQFPDIGSGLPGSDHLEVWGNRISFQLPQISNEGSPKDDSEINDFKLNNYAKYYKRVFDLAVTILSAPFVLLIVLGLLVIDAAVYGGKPLFRHKRVGRNGKVFDCLKIRTMAIDADKRLADLLERDPAAREEWRKFQKLSNDPRVTRLGNFMRKSNLDELPQFWNVLKGEMSLVGPRPVLPEELDRYGDAREAYLAVRPGITGLWQITPNRNSISYAERVALDVRYVQNMSLAGDLKILSKTATHGLEHYVMAHEHHEKT